MSVAIELSSVLMCINTAHVFELNWRRAALRGALLRALTRFQSHCQCIDSHANTNSSQHNRIVVSVSCRAAFWGVPPTQCLPWHVRTHLNDYSMSVFSVGYRRISRLAHTQDSRALEQLNSSTVSRQPLMGQRRSLPVETSASVTTTPSWYIRHHPSTLAPPSISRASFHVLANIPSLVALHTCEHEFQSFFSPLCRQVRPCESHGVLWISRARRACQHSRSRLMA